MTAPVFGCCVDKAYGKGCTDATCMKLPEGKTCGSCKLFSRCKAFGISTKPEHTDCDFFPRKYSELKVYTAGPPPDGRTVEEHLNELIDPAMMPPPSYPEGWPSCPSCGLPALDGHITCGQAGCDEAGRR